MSQIEYRVVGDEVWILDPVRCVAPPLTFLVLQGRDGWFYPLRLVGSVHESIFENGMLVCFEDAAAAWSFGQCVNSSARFSYGCLPAALIEVCA